MECINVTKNWSCTANKLNGHLAVARTFSKYTIDNREKIASSQLCRRECYLCVCRNRYHANVCSDAHKLKLKQTTTTEYKYVLYNTNNINIHLVSHEFVSALWSNSLFHCSIVRCGCDSCCLRHNFQLVGTAGSASKERVYAKIGSVCYRHQVDAAIIERKSSHSSSCSSLRQCQTVEQDVLSNYDTGKSTNERQTKQLRWWRWCCAELEQYHSAHAERQQQHVPTKYRNRRK